MRKALGSLLFGAVIALSVVGKATADEQTAIAQAIQLLKSHQLVGLAEPHQSVQFHEFLRDLVRSRNFPESVSTVVVEFGNARYQSLVDAYLAGASVPLERLDHVWRDTTQLLVWDAPMYREFFQTVRRVNDGLPPGKKIRVLLGDPPINWATTQTASDFPKEYGFRDWYYADVVEREILKKHRRALLIAGEAHLTHVDARAGNKPVSRLHDNVGSILRKEYPGTLFTIWPYFAAPPPANPPKLALIEQTEFGNQSFAQFMPNVMFIKIVSGKPIAYRPAPSQWPHASAMIDALLFLGPQDTLKPAAASDYDPAYLAELNRRATILKAVFGVDFTADLKALEHR